MKVLAIFDFDGTLTYRDSFKEFIRYEKGRFNFLLGLFILSPVLVLYALRIMSNSKAKQMVFSYYFKGMSLNSFNSIAIDYSMHHVDSIIRKDAWKALEKHKEQGHTVCIVTATPENIVGPWCSYHGVNCIGTKISIEQGIITGKFASKNCYGQEKVNRLKEVYALEKYDQIHAYGDSKGDKELLSIASQPNYRVFNAR